MERKVFRGIGAVIASVTDDTTFKVFAVIVLFHVAAAPAISDVAWPYLDVALFLVGIALVPLILFLDGRSTGQRARWPQYAIRTLTFAACAMAIAWPFDAWLAQDELRWPRSLAVLAIPLVGAVALRERHDRDPY